MADCFAMANRTMSRKWFRVALLALTASLSGQTLKKIAVIDLPGPKGQRFDYLAMDQDDHYLLAAHLGPGILYVIAGNAAVGFLDQLRDLARFASAIPHACKG